MIRPDYYSIDEWSNSELTRLHKIIRGELDLSKEDDDELDPQYFVVGNAYDAGVLGGKSPELSIQDKLMVDKMVKVSKIHPTIRAFIEHPDFRPQYSFHKKFYGLRFKSKLDGIIKPKRWFFELKSTKCATQEAFERIIDMFDYDRQIYVYMTISGCERCCIVGCQKSMNPKIFVKWVDCGDDVWRMGKMKTEILINHLRNMGVEFHDEN